MKDNFIISGVSGVGKDYALDRLKKTGFDHQKINMGKLIADEMAKDSALDSETQIDRAYEEARKRLMRGIGRIALSLYNVYGVDPQNLHSNYSRIITLPSIKKSVVLEADPGLVVTRRKSDESMRNRARNSAEEIAEIQRASTEVAKAVAKNKGIDLKIFRNDEDLDVEDIRDFLED